MHHWAKDSALQAAAIFFIALFNMFNLKKQYGTTTVCIHLFSKISDFFKNHFLGSFGGRWSRIWH